MLPLLLAVAPTAAPSAIPVLAPQNDVPHHPSITLTGPANELYATYVARAGDVDADGTPDVLTCSVVADTGAQVVRVVSGATQSVLHEWTGLANHPWLGRPMDGAGDLNGDGHADVWVADALGQGGARAYSGLDGSLLLTLAGPPQLGSPVANAGDVDGDGTPDVIVGSVNGEANLVQVHSGATGALLHAFPGPVGDRFGAAVAGAGDVDGDGFADLLVGAPGEGHDVLNPGIPPFVPPFWTDDDAGAVHVLSGATGQRLYSLLGDTEYEALGWSVDGLGDLDGDGHAEFAAATESLDDFLVGGYARVYRGVDGSVRYDLAPPSLTGQPLDPTQVKVAAVDDVDGDGVPDVGLVHRDATPWSHDLWVFSGADGSALLGHSMTAPFAPFLFDLDGVGDVDGDGTPDLGFAGQVPVVGLGQVELLGSVGPAGAAASVGCGLNPSGSLTLASGTPVPGATLDLRVDDPSNSMGVPCRVRLVVSDGAHATFPPCGLSVPGWNLAIPGAPGELLVGLDPLVDTVVVLQGPTYTGAPVSVLWTVPDDLYLVGETFYVQAVLRDPTGRTGLTECLELSIGSH